MLSDDTSARSVFERKGEGGRENGRRETPRDALEKVSGQEAARSFYFRGCSINKLLDMTKIERASLINDPTVRHSFRGVSEMERAPRYSI